MFFTNAATGSSAPAIAPSVTSATISLPQAGACKSPRGTGVSPSAVVRATWAIANADWVNYTVKVYKDGSLRKTITAAGTTTDDFTVTNYVQGDTGHMFTSAYVWRVDVVRNSDSVVVNTLTAATYRQQFGDCSGPA